MVDQSLVPELLQRLLSRLDHIEFGLLKHQQAETEVARQDIDVLGETISNMERARRLEAQDSLLADAIASAPRAALMSHRGPGILPAASAPPRGDVLDEPCPTAALAKSAPIWKEERAHEALPAMASRTDQGPSPGKGAFSNTLVKLRSPTSSPPQRFDIASPSSRAAGPASAPDVAVQQRPASSYQSPVPGRTVQSAGSPGFHAGVPTPPGLPHQQHSQ